MSQTKAQLIDPVDLSIVTADLADDAVTAAKLASNAVVNASVDASAAIAGTKISPDFGSQAISTTGGLSVNGATVFNESGADVDFRIEGDTDTNLFRLDASVDRIGIGISAPQQKLHIAVSDSGAANIAFTNSTTGSGSGDGLVIGLTGGEDGQINMQESANLKFSTADTERMRIDSAGRLLIGHSSDIGYGFRSQLVGTDGNTSSQAQIRFTNSASGPTFILAKSRNGTPGSKTIVNNNDNLGEIQFRGDDGVDYFGIAASIKTQIDGTPGAGDLPGRLVFSTTADGSDSATERMRISQSGDIAVNFDGSSQTGVFQIADGSASAPGLTFWADGGKDTGIFRSGANTLNFSTAGSERLRIDSSGNVGIGTASPSQLLQVAGTLECNNIKFLTANKFETSANVLEGKGTNGARLRSALSAASTPSFSNSDDADSGMFLPGSNVLGLSTGGSEALRIDANQHVLIGQSASISGLQVGTPPLQVTHSGADVAMFRRNSNDGGGPYLSFVKERSGAIVADGDLVGAMAFLAHDGTDLDSYAAQIKVEIDGTPGANITPGALSFHTSGSSANRTTERMVINSAGNIFIGTTPQGRLARMQISGNNFPTFALGGSQVPLIVSNQDEDYGIQLGTFSSGNGAIQVTRNDGVATAYNLMLQPSGGSVIVGNSSTGGDILFANTGSGIVLGSTSNVDSNTLDDYEEGSYSPAPDDGNNVFSTGQEFGRYTKIGNVVHVSFSFNCSLPGTSGFAFFINLPFQVKDFSAGAVNEGIGFSKGTGVEIQLEAQQGQTRCKLRSPSAGSALTPNNVGCVNNVTKAMRGAITYLTS